MPWRASACPPPPPVEIAWNIVTLLLNPDCAGVRLKYVLNNVVWRNFSVAGIAPTILPPGESQRDAPWFFQKPGVQPAKSCTTVTVNGSHAAAFAGKVGPW